MEVPKIRTIPLGTSIASIISKLISNSLRDLVVSLPSCMWDSAHLLRKINIWKVEFCPIKNICTETPSFLLRVLLHRPTCRKSSKKVCCRLIRFSMFSDILGGHLMKYVCVLGKISLNSLSSSFTRCPSALFFQKKTRYIL